MIAVTLAKAVDPGGWLHDLYPFVLRISGDFGVRWYGVSYLAGFVIAWLVLRALSRRGLIAVPADRAFDTVIMLAVGAIVGGRVGYCLLYRPSYLWSFTPDAPWWNLLAINKGGMASHGGMLGVVIAAMLIARGFRLDDGARVGRCPRMHVLDAVALVAPFGLFLGRLANFINGELLGRIVRQPAADARAPWWSVRYPQELLGEHAAGVERTEAQAAALARLVHAYTPPGEPVRAGIARVVELVQRGDEPVRAAIKPLLAARHPSQLYQATAEGLLVAAVVWWVARRPRRPGVVSAWFLIAYGLLRVLTEYFRLPDSHFNAAAGFFDLTGPTPLGLSRGQWYSMVMVAAGVALLLWRRGRSDERRDLGWQRPPVTPPAPASPG